MVCFDELIFIIFSPEGGILHVVNGPNRDQDRNVRVQGFTVRVADKVILQTWPSDEEQVHC